MNATLRNLVRNGRTGLALVGLLLLLPALVLVVGCASSEPTREALANALEPFIDDSAELVRSDVEWFTGEARAPEGLDRAGVFLITDEDELTRIWANQCDGPMPRVDFSREVVVAVFLTRSAATAVRFHGLRYNEFERAFDAYFLGELKPLTQVRYNYPYCLAVVPVRSGAVRVRMIHVRDLPDGGWEVQPFGPRTVLDVEPR